MNCVFIETCESTMDEAKRIWENEKHENGYIVYTHNQTKGRGRENRVWQSDKHDILFTFMFQTQTEEELRRSGVVSLLSLCSVLKEKYGIQVFGKWPNDGYVNNKKLFGILIEAEWKNNSFLVNIGIGINFYKKDLDYSISLSEIGDVSKINEVEVMTSFRDKFFELISQSYSVLLNQFKSIDFLNGKKVTLRLVSEKSSLANKEYNGMVVGYTTDWKVLIQTDNGIEAFDREEIVL
ncbi:biotin--acetyl-CoA-carboxylase ligase [Entamoeba histolytica HM-3:IMSS]|uniref:Biotin--acetyl-CoA-carboxylase ligase, putative n=4 Tax=Entamoeba histolytica TaxID=5759 RepID=C4M7Z4_ENTH1|nr:biotin--acetyl-CoA-carboxylase ligase, putative [Entamoeba histolytica HM-1:IMSS]EAL50169.1 biotin--acetyl-CoA-carboxylase ligase, putative [Entamoeba histolytica HM-1:IMSS]EMD42918.1 biotinacetyl-CoA-carboxylase ligase, putative [Entamoeba histolytica KU27]EMS16811.1 biotin--acetyl-CoA-carboxylase ligase [Entamoeba histolytica HM-3:IMSS]GAT97685.1 biotin--acetyl-coa-carboxylase ligase putative [Entamoeba histolytica]|eukprot:XP_655562.1 biotin--acetyl-CoA-carboxylase ligase, putative [Entamoeba histolytica HM-1:IMSS]